MSGDPMQHTWTPFDDGCCTCPSFWLTGHKPPLCQYCLSRFWQAPPATTTIVTTSVLTDADVERIADRVVEKLYARRKRSRK